MVSTVQSEKILLIISCIESSKPSASSNSIILDFLITALAKHNFCLTPTAKLLPPDSHLNCKSCEKDDLSPLI